LLNAVARASRSRHVGLAGLGLATLAFLITRVVFLDRDIPPWSVSQYSPIDEFTYVLPAFNLHHYGTWTHQFAPWAQVEGWPMNVAQAVLAAITLQVGGYSYLGLRFASVVFGLVAFLAMADVVRRRVYSAMDAGISPRLGSGVLAAALALLLLDFSFLLAGRIIEPTIARLAGIALLIWLVDRGYLLGDRHSLARSLALGAFVGVLVWFVYVYNAFIVPAAMIALVVRVRAAEDRGVVRHIAAFVLGALLVTILYFVFVYAVYGHSPIEWFRTWIQYYDDSSRVAGASTRNLWSMFEANIFRLDRSLLLLFLLSLPVFSWRTIRTRRPSAVLIASAFGLVLLQSLFVADYPVRKYLILVVLVVPVVVDGILHADQYVDWARQSRLRAVATIAWGLLAVAMLVSLLLPSGLAPALGLYQLVGEPRVIVDGYRNATLGLIVHVAGAIGVVAILTGLLLRRRLVRVAVGLALAVAVLLPLAYVDRVYVFGRPTYTYRDALIAVDGVLGEEATAGSWSVGMQLYNHSKPSLSGYHYGQSREAYLADVVRAFKEGRAVALFGYTEGVNRGLWEGLGFELVESYEIRLPLGHVLSRYRYVGGD
jgi:hypothetical protein